LVSTTSASAPSEVKPIAWAADDVGERAVAARNVGDVDRERAAIAGVVAHDRHRREHGALEVEVGLRGVGAEQEVRDPQLVTGGTGDHVVEAARLAVREPGVAARRDVGELPGHDHGERCRIDRGDGGAEQVARDEGAVAREAQRPRLGGHGHSRGDHEVGRHRDDLVVLRARDEDRRAIAGHRDADRLATDRHGAHGTRGQIDRVKRAGPHAGDVERLGPGGDRERARQDRRGERAVGAEHRRAERDLGDERPRRGVEDRHRVGVRVDHVDRVAVDRDR
jgi:hypothetical protein